MDYTVVRTRFYEGYLHGSVSQLQPCWCLALGHSWLHGLAASLPQPGLPRGSEAKNPPANAGDTGRLGSVPGLGRSPGGGNGNPREYSCLEIPWTEEPAGLQPTGSQRVKHDWAHIPYPTASTYQPPAAPQRRQPKNVSINCQISQWSKITIPLALKVTCCTQTRHGEMFVLVS